MWMFFYYLYPCLVGIRQYIHPGVNVVVFFKSSSGLLPGGAQSRSLTGATNCFPQGEKEREREKKREETQRQRDMSERQVE